MSGQLYRFEFSDNTARIHDIINDVTITAIEVSIVHERSGYVLAVYRRTVNSEVERREGIYALLRDVDIEFVCCPPSDRALFRVKVAGVV